MSTFELSKTPDGAVSVLLADDDRGFREFVSDALAAADEPVHVEGVANGEEALARFDDAAFDCVVSDYQMPRVDGLELLRRVRKRDSDIPFLIVTARGDESLASEAIREGATDYVPKRRASEDVSLLINVVRNAVNRRRVQAALQAERWFIDEALESIEDCFFVADINGAPVRWNDRLSAVTGYDDDTLADMDPIRLFAEADRESVRAGIEAVFEAGKETIEASIRTKSGECIPYELTVSRLSGEDGSPVGICGIARDVTERNRRLRALRESRRELATRERTLRTLHDASRGLLRAESVETVCKIAIDAVDELLELPLAGVYLWHDAAGELRPEVTSETTTELLESVPVFDGDDSVVWEAFVDGSPRRYEDVSTEPMRYNAETDVRTELVLPLGTHGVIVAGSPKTDAIDESDFESADVLATSVEAALNRTEREEAIRRQERRLTEQNEQLERVNRLNELIRETVRTLVGATTHEGVEEALCTHLSGADRYRLAWVGTAVGELDVRQWSGPAGAYLDDCRSVAPSERPAAVAEREERPVVVDDTLTDDGPCRDAALNHGLRSSITLPLTHGIRRYGVLEVHADRPGVFHGDERAVLAELADVAATVLSTLDRENARQAGNLSRVEMAVNGPVGGVFSLAESVGADLVVTRTQRNAEGWTVRFRTEITDPTTIETAVQSLVGIESVTHLGSDRSETEYRATLTSFPTAAFVADRGIDLRKLRVGPAESRLDVVVPADTDIRSLVTAYDDAVGTARLVSKTAVGSRAADEPTTDSLTDRQREALDRAVHGGYFEWPRERTGEELAEEMDISAPTFHQHIRGGLRRLLEARFGDDE